MISLRCAKHPAKKYLAVPKTPSKCEACADIEHLIREKHELPKCWEFEIVLGNGRKL